MLNVQMMPSSLLNFGDSHQAFAGLVSTLAWSTTLAYSGLAGYITSRGRCAFQSNIVWHGQHVGVVSVESMFCWGVLATLLRIRLLFSEGAQAGEVWLWGAAVGLNIFFFGFKVYWQSRLSRCKRVALQLWLYVSSSLLRGEKFNIALLVRRHQRSSKSVSELV